ncbi:hypothetical protein DUZ99_03310 [Xylanibacillus composti]|uniref:Uncharacterized protein n=1 Tax=Xylanibacillus composti TaxID=1572762 RepID=A0A8J4H711_9BACL|nr:hypothetical protein [Xylanibacillus composti]MDT9724028.1 hypothetical protein [Xylanibacillus composti]GIQ71066.1 hypothetical protein XYCOK13_38900 [Xylanibacillus composti]
MYLFQYLNLQAGALCKITSPASKFEGQIVEYERIEYYMQKPYFIFRSIDQKRVILDSDAGFCVLPYRGSLEFLIGLALQTKDREWFNELVYRWKHEAEVSNETSC